MSIKTAILTISDRCFVGSAEDKSGALIQQFLQTKKFEIVQQCIVPDDKSKIKELLENWSDILKVDLIITTGGTGFTARDVTPEVTKSVIDREASIHIALMVESLKFTPMAMLSRLTSGIRKSSLIINFPGSAKACEQCLTIIEPVLRHAVDQLRGDAILIEETHTKMHQIPAINTSKVKLQKVSSRPRVSQYRMITMSEAIATIINETLDICQTETLDINQIDKINGRILATDVLAKTALPPFDASVKDGYAVIAADGSGSRKLISSSATAGTYIQTKITSGYCSRISTGAAVPEGADAVVQVEDTKVLEETEDGEERVILIEKSPSKGQDIRPIGCDISVSGEPILNKYTLLGPIELGLLAAIGVDKVLTFKRPIVSVLSTGDEITNPGDNLRLGCVWDSNRTTILSLLRKQSFDYLDLGIARDEINDLYHKLNAGLNNSDVIITTGGVSMGEKDLLKQMIETDFGAQIHFGRVNLKPGKPTTFATCVVSGRKRFIFALPGNPVSAYVTFYLFVLPALNALSGKLMPKDKSDICAYHPTLNVVLKLDSGSLQLDDRPEWARAVLSYGDSNASATITGSQRSSRLMSAKNANALVLLPQRSQQITQIKSGDIVTAILL